MTLEDLRIFVAVCEQNSLSAVARSHARTQPAISQHIRRLERELDVALLERSVRGVTPTVAGGMLLDSARESLAALRNGIASIDELQGRARRSIRIATGGTSVRHFLRDSVVSFRQRHADARLEFVPANSTARCLELVRGGDADLGLVTVHGQQPGVEQIVLAQQEVRLLVSRDHALSNRRRLKIRDLDGLSVVALGDQTTSAGHLEEAFEHQGIRVETSTTVDDFDTACVFVELGLGCAFVPAVHAASFVRTARVHAVSVEALPALSIGLAAKRFNSLAGISHEFIECFLDELDRLGRLPGVKKLTASVAELRSKLSGVTRQ